MASSTVNSMTCNIRFANGTKNGKQLVKSRAIGPTLDPSGATDDRLYAIASKVKKLYEETVIDYTKTVKSTLSA